MMKGKNMEVDYWECDYHEFLVQTKPKMDENNIIVKGKYDIFFIFGCEFNPAPKGMINLCKMKMMLSSKGFCSLQK